MNLLYGDIVYCLTLCNLHFTLSVRTAYTLRNTNKSVTLMPTALVINVSYMTLTFCNSPSKLSLFTPLPRSSPHARQILLGAANGNQFVDAEERLEINM